jgi:hypothetical protein
MSSCSAVVGTDQNPAAAPETVKLVEAAGDA